MPGWAVLLAVALLVGSGCGGEDEGSESDAGAAATAAEATTASSDGDCIAAWNDGADEGLKGIAALSNDPQLETQTGAYSGEPFSAEAFDGTTTGTGQQVEVAPGDCVVTEFSPDYGMPLFVFVQGADGTWHRLSETGKHPLAGDPGSLLESPVAADVAAQGDLEPAG